MQTESSFMRKKKEISEHSATAGHEIKTRKISEDPGLGNSGLNSCRLVFTDEKNNPKERKTQKCQSWGGGGGVV